MPRSGSVAAGFVASGLGAMALAGAAQAGPVAWEQIARSPGGLSAIATGIEMLGSCKAPLTFEQSSSGSDELQVTIVCSNTGDGAGAVIVKFTKFPGAKSWFATSFEFAG